MMEKTFAELWAEEACPHCDGEGQFVRPLGYNYRERLTCPWCKGTGRAVKPMPDNTTLIANHIADKIESYTTADILLHAGELTAQEMRTVKAIQKWWVAEIRQFAKISE